MLDLGSGVSAAYAAKLLGDDGADVIKVEEPLGDAARRRGPFPNDRTDEEKSGLFLALNVNKRGVCLDLASPTGRRSLERLVAWSEILVHNYSRLRADALGLIPDVLQARHPGVVVLSITPFGITGPYRDCRATELIVANASGWAVLCPATHPEIDLPPLKVFGHQCAMMTATAGAMAALAALRDARRSGIGEHIDLSEAYVTGVLEGAVPTYAYRDLVLKRNHPRSLIPWRTFQTKDFPIFLMCAEQDQWERLVDFMGRPDWTDLEVFADRKGRAENQDMVHEFVQEFVGQWNALDFYHAAQSHRICVAPIEQYADLAANQHLRARAFFATVDHADTGPVEHLASPMMTTAGRPPIRRPAPRLGEHNGVIDALEARPPPPERSEKPGPPLHGVRVVDLTWVWAGTFGTMNLAHLGADVIRLESVGRADMYRRLGPFPNDAPPDLDCSGMFNQWNQGKKSVAVDLRDPRGIDIVKEFVRISDVVMQNFGNGVMERLGLDYEVLRQVNPRIILASISGYGQSGPHRNYIGYGPSISPLGGSRGGLDAGSGPLADHVTTSSGGPRSFSHFHEPGHRRRSASERPGDYRTPATRPRRRSSPYGYSLAIFKARQRRALPRALPRRGHGCAARRNTRL